MIHRMYGNSFSYALHTFVLYIFFNIICYFNTTIRRHSELSFSTVKIPAVFPKA